jgi:hypothetical protein
VVASGAACRRTGKLVRTGDAAPVVVVAPESQDPTDLALPPEQEPNDTVPTAQLLAFGGEPPAAGALATVTGSGKKRDVDLFRIVVPGPAAATDAAPTPVRMSIEVRPAAGLALALQFLDERGQVRASAVAPAGERDGLPNEAVAPGGTYLVRVRAADSTRLSPDAGAAAVYRLGVHVAPFETGDEREPNGTAAQANDLPGAEKGAEAAGFLGPRRDEDWYRVRFEGLGAPAAITAEVDAVEDVAITVAVHDAAGARLASGRGRRGERAAVEAAGIPGGAGGAPATSCFVVLKAESGRNLDQRYVLRVRAEVRDEPAPAPGGPP